MCKVVLAPTLEIAKEFINEHAVVATVEAEYGDEVIEGARYTLAHHGPRANNPAPCNVEVEPVDGTILVSHIDLDTVGGVLALHGRKPKKKAFWEAAEYIDIHGPHHLYELPLDIQNALNAVYAFGETLPRPRELMDVTGLVDQYAEHLEKVLDDRHPEHESVIENGRRWAEDKSREVEALLIAENNNIRVFKSNGVFCAGSYYSPRRNRIIPATLTLNEKFGNITLAFAEASEGLSAREIVQELWGPEAGGRDGIAGSPRGQVMTMEDLQKAIEFVNRKINECK